MSGSDLTVREFRDVFDGVKDMRLQIAKLYTAMAEQGSWLKQISERVGDLNGRQKEMNGKVGDHAIWIAGNANIIDRNKESVERLFVKVGALEAENAALRENARELAAMKATVQRHQDALQLQEGARGQSKKDWAVTIALLGIVGGIVSMLLGLAAKAIFHIG